MDRLRTSIGWPPGSPSRCRRASSAIRFRRLDQVALDDRPVRADHPPGQDVGVGAGLVDEPADEGAVAGLGVDAAVEGPDLVEPLLRVGAVVDVADGQRAQLLAGRDHALEPRVLPAPGVQHRDHRSAPLDLVVRPAHRLRADVRDGLATTAARHAVRRHRRGGVERRGASGRAWRSGTGSRSGRASTRCRCAPSRCGRGRRPAWRGCRTASARSGGPPSRPGRSSRWRP